MGITKAGLAALSEEAQKRAAETTGHEQIYHMLVLHAVKRLQVAEHMLWVWSLPLSAEWDGLMADAANQWMDETEHDDDG